MTPKKQKPSAKGAVEKAERAVARAAMVWWAAARPVDWDEAQHIANPDVNRSTESQSRLAYAVAKLAKARRAAK